MHSNLVEMVESSFGSVWSLEVLLLLWRQPQRSWSSAELVTELRSSEIVVAQSCSDLLAAGLIVTEGGGQVRYAPASPDINSLVQALSDEYKRRPDAIRRLIIRRGADKLKTFSDAFKLGKD